MKATFEILSLKTSETFCLACCYVMRWRKVAEGKKKKKKSLQIKVEGGVFLPLFFMPCQVSPRVVGFRRLFIKTKSHLPHADLLSQDITFELRGTLRRMNCAFV